MLSPARMRELYLASVYIHVMAAITWVGGMVFIVAVVVPWLRRGDRRTAALLMRDTGKRFRSVGWACLLLLVVTGTFNLWARGVRIQSLWDPMWLASPFGRAVIAKTALVTLILVISVAHDFFIGPAASRAVETGRPHEEAERLRRRASLLGRANLTLALLVVAVAITLSR